MFMNNIRRNLNLINPSRFIKILNGFNGITLKKFVSCNSFYTNYQSQHELYNPTSNFSYDNILNIKSDFFVEDSIIENQNLNVTPKAEFLNKTSKLAIRKRKKRKYGKKTSLRYR